MSKNVIETSLTEFLTSDTAQIIAISGAWGSGKTYLAKKALEKKINKKYSYVSLFGLKTLDEVKLTVFSELSDFKGTRNRTFSILKKNQESLLKVASSIIPGMGGVVNSIDFTPFLLASIQRQIICFDDLERRGEGLRLKDIFGLANYFKEEKNCSVLLVLNYDELKDGDKKDFRTYLEKTVDISLEYQPDFEDMFTIALEICGKLHLTDSQIEQVKDQCNEIKIVNIRILIRIIRFCEQFISKLNENGCSDEDFISSAISELVLCASLYFKGSRNAPPLEYLLQKDLYYKRQKKNKLDEEEKSHIDFLERHAPFVFYTRIFDSEKNYSFLDFFIHSVQSGYFDDDVLKKLVAEHEKLEEQQRAGALYREAEYLFKQTFSENGDEIAEKFLAAFEVDISTFNVPSFNMAISILKGIKQDDEARKILKIFEDACKNGEVEFNRANFVDGSLTAPELEKIYKKYYDQYTQKKFDNLNDAFEELSQNDTSEAALSYAKDKDVKEYIRLLTDEAIEGQQLMLICEWRERTANFPPDSDLKLVHDKINAALKQIKKEGGSVRKHRITNFWRIGKK